MLTQEARMITTVISVFLVLAIAMICGLVLGLAIHLIFGLIAKIFFDKYFAIILKGRAKIVGKYRIDGYDLEEYSANMGFGASPETFFFFVEFGGYEYKIETSKKVFVSMENDNTIAIRYYRGYYTGKLFILNQL